MKQLHDGYDYIRLHNQIRTVYDRILRINQEDYSEIAIGKPCWILWYIGITPFLSVSMQTARNSYLEVAYFLRLQRAMWCWAYLYIVCPAANVCYRLQLIEAYGTRLQIIKMLLPLQLKTIIQRNLPNINYKVVTFMITGQACSEEKMVLRFLKEKSHYTHRCGKSYK